MHRSIVTNPAAPACPAAPPVRGQSPDRLLSGPLPGLVAAAGAVLALAGLGFGLGALKAVPAPVVVAVAEPPPDPPAGVGGPEEPAGGTAGGLPDLVAEAARATAVARKLGADDLSRPVLRPVQGGWISSGFGRRADPFSGRPALHAGVDFAGVPNSAIVAAGAGVVSWSGGHRGYGNLIEIDHGNGYVSRYGHNAANLVAAGDYVKAGQVIALMGSTGRSTGSHLHFEVLRDGRPVNPVRLVPRS
jgi:murein DD-endopeptidase MepM/ murein hydrolase activator NlpD